MNMLTGQHEGNTGTTLTHGDDGEDHAEAADEDISDPLVLQEARQSTGRVTVFWER